MSKIHDIARRALALRASFSNGVHADRLLRARVSGRCVSDAGKPVSGAQVTFLDTGLDQVASRNPDASAQLLGQTGPDGTFSFDLSYRWGRFQAGVARPSPVAGAFSLRFEAPGHLGITIEVDLDDLARGPEGRALRLDPVTLPTT